MLILSLSLKCLWGQPKQSLVFQWDKGHIFVLLLCMGRLCYGSSNLFYSLYLLLVVSRHKHLALFCAHTSCVNQQGPYWMFLMEVTACVQYIVLWMFFLSSYSRSWYHALRALSLHRWQLAVGTGLPQGRLLVFCNYTCSLPLCPGTLLISSGFGCQCAYWCFL